MDGFRPKESPVRPQAQSLPEPIKPTSPAAPVFDMSLPGPSLSLPRKKKSRRLLWILLIPAFIVAAAIVSLVITYSWYGDALKPRASTGSSVRVQIDSGATIEQVGKELEEKSIIKSGLAFVLYMKLHNKNIKTGAYFLSPTQNVSQIVEWLNEGRVDTRQVTILPGKTLKQIRQDLIDAGFSADDVDAALSKKYNHPLLAEKPAGANLEGYIFPETYFVTSDSTADQLLIRTFDEFQKKIEENGLRAKLTARGFNLYQGITLASIVGKEVTHAEDQKKVAQVFETRLTRGMVLGSDVTYHYAAELLGVERSASIDSPYNTRKSPGLPPGPIANFNLQVLQAVADPAPGDYLYFVAGDDGTTYYAKTFEEHQQNVNKHCIKLCAQE